MEWRRFFFTAVGEFILLGKDKKALEILRLSAQYKIKHNLEKNYEKVIESFQSNFKDDKPHVTSNKVWVCWFQGIDNAPALVKKMLRVFKTEFNRSGEYFYYQ